MPQLRSSTLPRRGRRIARAIPVLAAFMCSSGLAAAAHAAPAIRVSVAKNFGDYSISSRRPAWAFSGTVHARLHAVRRTHGRDRLGPYRQISFAWRFHGQPVTGAIRTYDTRPAVQFILTFKHATRRPQLEFPNFVYEPRGLHVLSFRDRAFGPPRFSAARSGTPWLLFDRHYNAAIVSPARHFIVMTMRGNGHARTAVRLNRNIPQAPAGYQTRALMVITPGINRAFDLWGHALTTLAGKTRPTNEAARALRYLGYWTDNGAAYYYHFNPRLGYARTVLRETRYLQDQHIPIHYVEIDSWWYRKDATDYRGKPARPMLRQYARQAWDNFGGTTHYTASRHLFPNGLNAFAQQLGLPLIVHGRWISRKSPYHQRYKIVGVAPVGPRYWNHIAKYLAANGVMTYLQDWQSAIARHSHFFSNLHAGRDFYHNMANRLAAHGVNVMYCMPLPCALLESTRLNNVFATRVNHDIFIPARFFDCLFNSRLASAVGLWPWDDVCMSWRPNTLLLQTLSAGAVGFGDPIYAQAKKTLMRTVRRDGVIIKPDVPIVPIDRAYLNAARHVHAPVIARTYTDQGGVKTAYVFAFAPTRSDVGKVKFSAAAIGLRGPMFVYNYYTHACAFTPAGGTFSGRLGKNRAAFYVCAAPGVSGVAFMGQPGKFVGTGRARIPFLADRPNGLTATVALAAGEEAITLHGFAANKPMVTVRRGLSGAVRYNATTHHFTVRVSPNYNAPLRALDGAMVKEIRVTFAMRRPGVNGSR